MCQFSTSNERQTEPELFVLKAFGKRPYLPSQHCDLPLMVRRMHEVLHHFSKGVFPANTLKVVV
jgi:hypothetical protein